MSLDLEIRGAVILSSHNGYVPFVGSVGIEDDRIAAVSGNSLGAVGSRVIDAGGKILMPGLINGHCHGDMTFARGLGDGMTLAEQISAFEPTDWFHSLINDDIRYMSRQLTYCEALLSGTTFILENMYWPLGLRSIKAMAETGIRGALAEDVRKDFAVPDIMCDTEELRTFKSECEKSGIIPVIGGLSEEDFEPGRLKRVAGIVRRLGCRYTLHLAETRWRMELVEERAKTTSVRFLRDMGMLGPDVIASHVVHPAKEEIIILKDQDVKVVNTPMCEMKIADGIAPIPEMIGAGITVGLGTDGAMWNNSNDIFREMKALLLLHTVNSGIRAVKTSDVLDMATIRGARVFGMHDKIGSVEEGKMADLILVDATAPHMRPLRVAKHENVASSIAFNATGRDVTDVFVGGRRLVYDGRMTDFPLNKLAADLEDAASEFAEQLGELKRFE
ncbi:MAG: amidohydrolase family protein [Synergistaceae bacterium]|jgi:5-methylthioadenosine/S-adenosylhomocysteine deaminase|nr:amidohydrolase family protein [Synergistaceae bacterium]